MEIRYVAKLSTKSIKSRNCYGTTVFEIDIAKSFPKSIMIFVEFDFFRKNLAV